MIAPRSVAGLVALAVSGAVVLVAALLLRAKPGPTAERVAKEKLAPVAAAGVRGVQDAEIVLGMASPFSGANRELGREMKAGVEAAFGAANQAGGIHGRRLRLVAVDDGYEPSRTGPAMRELVEVERVFAIVGNVGTPTAEVAIPYCLQKKVVFFGALSGGAALRKTPPDRYVFNFRPSYSEETSAAVRYLVTVRHLNPRRIAVFSQQDEFGESGWSGVAPQLATYGVDPAHVVRAYYRRNTDDVAEAVATLRARAPEVDAVVMIATYKAAAAFVRRSRDAGLNYVVTNVSAVDSDALAEELVSLGPRYARDVIVTQVVPPPTSRAPGVVRFRKELAKHAPGERPGFVALEGFVVGNLLAEGLHRAGRELDTEKLVAALESIRDLDLGIGTTITFAPREHQGSHRVWGTALQADGSYRPIELE